MISSNKKIAGPGGGGGSDYPPRRCASKSVNVNPLMAMAKLGQWCLVEMFAESDEVFRYAMDDKAIELGLIRQERINTLTDKRGKIDLLAQTPKRWCA